MVCFPPKVYKNCFYIYTKAFCLEIHFAEYSYQCCRDLYNVYNIDSYHTYLGSYLVTYFIVLIFLERLPYFQDNNDPSKQ